MNGPRRRLARLDAIHSRWRRVREIGLAGIGRRLAFRLRKAGSVRAREEWTVLHAGSAPTDERVARALGVPIGRIDAVAEAIQTVRRPFWIDVADASLRAAFRARHPAAAVRIREQAEATLAGDLSWVVPGGVADWHAALPYGGRWPLDASESIAIGADRPLGDVRLSWEIGRCTHVVRLAQAAWLEGDRRLANAVVATLFDWIESNPPGRGIAWLHAQEAALRAVAWLWAIELVRPLGVVDARALRAWAWLLHVHGTYVESHLGDHPITNNHLISESAGLFVLGHAMPMLAGADRWRTHGRRVLLRELEKQVDAEGVQAEHATHYHAFVLDSLVAADLLAARAGAPFPARARTRIAAMTDTLASWLHGDGTLPAIGDTDAGRAWRLGLDPLDRRDLLAAAAIAFERRDWGACAGDAAGAFWIGGGRPVPGAGDPAPPGRARRFEAAGLGVARTGSGPEAELFVFRAGPTRFRSDVARGHLHADALSVVWRIGAEDVLVDPGTYLYSEGEGWRAALRASAAHGCVVVDDRDQADVTSRRFGISGESPSRWLGFEADASGMRAAAERDQGNLVVRRRLAWRAGRWLVLCDDVLGRGVHRVAGWLQLPATTGDASGRTAVLRLASGRVVSVCASPAVERIEILRPSPDAGPCPGWRAPRYGLRMPGTALRCDGGACPLPVRIVTVIQVGAVGVEPSPAQIEASGDGVLVGVGGDRVRFDATTGVTTE